MPSQAHWPAPSTTYRKVGFKYLIVCARGCGLELTQKVAAEPYQVLGTLFDQIAYPAESSDGLTRQRAIEILDEVELSYLADRPDIFEKETNWEEEISLGLI